jgi:hypothetical protein
MARRLTPTGALSQANERVHNDKQRKYCKASFKMKELKKYHRTKATALPAGSPADTSVFDLSPYWIRSTQQSASIRLRSRNAKEYG